jgi:YD repeat-containing protein
MSANRTTAYTYNADGKLLTVTAINGEISDDQVTRFVYRTMLEESGVASNQLLLEFAYEQR